MHELYLQRGGVITGQDGQACQGRLLVATRVDGPQQPTFSRMGPVSRVAKQPASAHRAAF